MNCPVNLGERKNPTTISDDWIIRMYMKIRKTAIIWIAALLVSLYGCANKRSVETMAEIATTETRVTEATTEPVTTRAVIETEPPSTAAPETTEAVTKEAAKLKPNYLGVAAVYQNRYSSESYDIYIGFKEAMDGEWIPQEATVHLKIVNDNGEVVYDKDRNIDRFSYKECTLSDGPAMLSVHSLTLSTILRGSVSTGTIYASTTLPDGRRLEASSQITDLHTDDVATAESTAEAVEDTYEHNEYYDVVEKASYSKYGDTTFVFKVLAKKSVSMELTVYAFAPNGDVLAKLVPYSLDLTEGEYNFFFYTLDSDEADAEIQITRKIVDWPDSFLGDRDAVEMVKYNKSGTQLYITFKQVKENLGTFSEFKLLFYKDDQIVGLSYGYFSLYAGNLDGIGTTDIASVLANVDFDRIEYIYEP